MVHCLERGARLLDYGPADDTHKHTHTHLTALFPGLPRWAGTRKVKPIWISLKQESLSGSGISWCHMQVCTSLQTDNQASTPPLSFLQAGCPSSRPTNSVKALKALELMTLHPKTPSTLATFKSRLVLAFWYQRIQTVLEKSLPLNGYSSSRSTVNYGWQKTCNRYVLQPLYQQTNVKKLHLMASKTSKTVI